MSQNFADRRSEIRFNMDARPPVPVRSLDGKSHCTGAVIDISGSGLRIRCAASFPPGSILRLALSPLLITGEVRYCRPSDDDMFDAGLRILSAQSLDSPADFLEYVPGPALSTGGDR